MRKDANVEHEAPAKRASLRNPRRPDGSGGRVVLALLGAVSLLLGGGLLVVLFAPAAWPRYAEFLLLALPAATGLSGFALGCHLSGERRRERKPGAHHPRPTPPLRGAGTSPRPTLRLVGGTGFRMAGRTQAQLRGGDEGFRVVFTGAMLEVLDEMAERENVSLEDVLRDAIALKEWRYMVEGDGGAVLSRRSDGSFWEIVRD
ncbi:MAG: hypothetical protein M3P49_07030 [Actinomycetota bacterium]|nr:hypothetical protein [Actinomycetota bacterium]